MKIHYTLSAFLLTMLFSLSIFAQGWERIYGDPGPPSRGEQVIQTSDGHYIASGFTSGNIANNEWGGYCIKFDEQGETIWQHSFSYTQSGNFVADMNNETYFYFGHNFLSVPGAGLHFRPNLRKIDEAGNVVLDTTFMYPNMDREIYITSGIVLDDNSFVFYGFQTWNPSSSISFIGQIDSDGNLLWDNYLPSFGSIYGESENGGYLLTNRDDFHWFIHEVDGMGNWIKTDSIPWTEGGRLSILDNDEYVIHASEFISFDTIYYKQIKLNAQYDIIDLDTIWNGPNFSSSNVEVAEDGFLIQAQTGATPIPTDARDGIFIKTDFDGNIIFEKIYNHRPGSQRLFDIVPSHDKGYLLTGINTANGSTDKAYVFKTDENGDIYTNVISGNVSVDNDSNCEINTGDTNISDWFVLAEKPNQDYPFMSSTNIYGEYILPVDTGDYIIKLIPPNEYWDACENDIPISFANFYNDEKINFPVEELIDCPSMLVSGTTPSLRPCFERPVFIEYCNYGTVTAEDARVEINLDTFITAISSTVPWTNITADNIVVWELGDLEPFECGSFRLNVFLDCDAQVGVSYCIEARAYPDTLCVPNSPLSSGAFLEVNGACEDSTIYFEIKNIGDDGMQQSSNYIIVEDAILMMEAETEELLPNEATSIPVTGNGSTYTLIAEQVPNAPGTGFPIAVIEGCGTDSSGNFSINFSNQFPLNDFNPYVDIDCPIAVNSYDPNDKRGFPLGYQDQHFIFPETPIEYIIRFQNTGTDTAYTVYIKDTLDQNLDVATFQRGASSHPYDIELNGQGELRFNFNNINLVDSTTNELASQGFVSFTITPYRDAPLGTVVKNKAAIYFDYNPPIITNKTFHTIQEDFIEVLVGTIEHPYLNDISVSVFPNPFTENAFVEIKGHEANNYLLEIYDVAGQLIRSEQFNNDKIEIKRKGMIGGLYFYRLSAEDGFLNVGRVLVR